MGSPPKSYLEGRGDVVGRLIRGISRVTIWVIYMVLQVIPCAWEARTRHESMASGAEFATEIWFSRFAK